MAGVKRRHDEQCSPPPATEEAAQEVTEGSSTAPPNNAQPDVPEVEGASTPPRKKRRRVEFQDVTVYHFNRRQGFICVPSQGGNTLGMEDDHFAVEVFTVDEHIAERRAQFMAPQMPADPNQLGLPAMDGSMGPSAPPIVNDEAGEEGEDYSSILMPVDSKERRTVLRATGIVDIDTWEKEECKQLRVSRQQCGCTCGDSPCLPGSCSCANGSIMCQVDRMGFPCSCVSSEMCGNPNGRLEFNPVKVRTHFVKTIMRTRLEEAHYNLHRQQQTQQDATAIIPPLRDSPENSNYLNRKLGYLAAQLYAGEGTSSSMSTMAGPPTVAGWAWPEPWAGWSGATETGCDDENADSQDDDSGDIDESEEEIADDEEEEEESEDSDQVDHIVDQNLAQQSVVEESSSEAVVRELIDSVISNICKDEPVVEAATNSDSVQISEYTSSSSLANNHLFNTDYMHHPSATYWVQEAQYPSYQEVFQDQVPANCQEEKLRSQIGASNYLASGTAVCQQQQQLYTVSPSSSQMISADCQSGGWNPTNSYQSHDPSILHHQYSQFVPQNELGGHLSGHVASFLHQEAHQATSLHGCDQPVPSMHDNAAHDVSQQVDQPTFSDYPAEISDSEAPGDKKLPIDNTCKVEFNGEVVCDSQPIIAVQGQDGRPHVEDKTDGYAKEDANTYDKEIHTSESFPVVKTMNPYDVTPNENNGEGSMLEANDDHAQTEHFENNLLMASANTSEHQVMKNPEEIQTEEGTAQTTIDFDMGRSTDALENKESQVDDLQPINVEAQGMEPEDLKSQAKDLEVHESEDSQLSSESGVEVENSSSSGESVSEAKLSEMCLSSLVRTVPA